MTDLTQGGAAHTTKEQHRNAGENGGEQGAKAAVNDAADRAHELKGTGREDAARVVHEVASQTSHLVDETRQRTKARVDTQVNHLASMLGDMSGDLDRMADETETSLGTLARDGATAMRSVSQRLERDGLDGVMSEARQFARRRPMTFVAGAFAFGMIAGRLVRNADVGAIAKGAGEDRPSSQNGGARSTEAATARSDRPEAGATGPNISGAFVGSVGGRP